MFHLDIKQNLRSFFFLLLLLYLHFFFLTGLSFSFLLSFSFFFFFPFFLLMCSGRIHLKGRLLFQILHNLSLALVTTIEVSPFSPFSSSFFSSLSSSSSFFFSFLSRSFWLMKTKKIGEGEGKKRRGKYLGRFFVPLSHYLLNPEIHTHSVLFSFSAFFECFLCVLLLSTRV